MDSSAPGGQLRSASSGAPPARVAPDERAGLADWITPAQLALFDPMHVADRRHGLDVVATLRAEGVTDPEVLLAGLLHDAGKGTPGSGRGSPIRSHGGTDAGSGGRPAAARDAGAIERLRDHAETSAQLAAAAVGITASLLPFEFYELCHRLTATGVIITVINILILWYLIVQLMKDRRHGISFDAAKGAQKPPLR